jgi:glycopeptide antibiotics resistance protein
MPLPHSFKQWFWSILTISTVIAITTVPMPPSAPHFEYSDKLGHILYFGLIATVLIRWLKPWTVVGFGVALSIAVELAQYFTPWRSCEVADAVCGSAGTIVAVLLYRWPPLPQPARTGDLVAIAS